MRRVSLEFVEPGMIIGRSIYNAEGRPLLMVGMVLNEKYIKRLEDYGVGAIYVKDDIFDQCMDQTDVISEQNRLESVNTVREAFKNFETKKRLNTKGINRAVNNLIDELLSNRGLLVNCSDIRTYDDYTFSHSVQVCILSLMMGIALGYDQLKLKEIGTGALIHDIGKIRVDKEVLNKVGALTPQEFEQIKQHAEHGFEMLRVNRDISLLSAHIAYQHHEHGNGKGYPRGLSGKDIHPYARIVAVADVFDALVADRPYRRAYSTSQAITIMQQGSGTQFEPLTLETLMSNVAEFPIGSVVSLSTGEIAVVVDNNKDIPTKPIIRIVLDRRIKRLNKPREVDLTKDYEVQISRVLLEEEINKLLKNILP